MSRSSVDTRPSPDALLLAAQRETPGKGRLKIFLGAAPGVGKTYEMLLNAQARRREGVDVVVGVVETHGRVDTVAMLDGLEIVPRRRLAYRGRDLDEMDLDGVLARRPALVLVDELAHTNADGSRHPKRFLDVEELLAAGIDVHSTLNIQHVESLNDVVAQITRIRVRETVPDRILDRADDIEVIDLAPDDLIRRLRDGKVYVPKNADRALKHYFSTGNLTALRELALRRTAQRVDEQLLSHMRAHAIEGPWAAGERVLVCVSEDRRGPELVRAAKRLADRLRAPWTALVVETSRTASLPDEARDRIAETLRLAERLGGEALTIPATTGRIADNVVSHARDANVTHIVIGKSTRSRWFEILNGSVVHDLVRASGQINVHVVAGKEPQPEPTRASGTPVRSRIDPVAYGSAVLATAVALALAKITQPWVGLESVDLIFLTAVVGVAVRFGLGPSLAAVVLSCFAYNFFFLPPTWTLTVSDPTNVAALVLFTIVAVVVSNLAGRARRQALAAAQRTRTTEALYAFSRKLASSGVLDDVLWASAYQIASMLRLNVVLLLPAETTLSVAAAYPPEDRLDAADLAAARWTFDHATPAGRGADTLPGAKRLFLPMRTSRGVVGVIGLDSERSGPLLTPDSRRLLDALADQASLAVERVHLVQDLDQAKLAAETDRLRQALLTSISHDLKTPLAAILGSASTLRDLDADLSAPDKADLVGTVIEEAQRLNRFIANLLDMTRLEAGAVRPNLAPADVGEIVGSALARGATILAGHHVETDLAADLPTLPLDAVLFEQIIFNLFDNAAKYAEAGTTIRIELRREPDSILLRILDEGPGIPAGELEQVFDKFYRARKADAVRAGTGLGLAISRGFVEAMGGTVVAANRSDRSGAVFTINLPVTAVGRLDAAA